MGIEQNLIGGRSNCNTRYIFYEHQFLSQRKSKQRWYNTY